MQPRLIQLGEGSAIALGLVYPIFERAIEQTTVGELLAQMDHYGIQFGTGNMQQTGTGPDGIDRRGSHELIETAQLHRLTKQALGAQGQLRAGIERSDLKALLSEVETVPTRAAARIDDMSAGSEQRQEALVKRLHIDRQRAFDEAIGVLVVVIDRHSKQAPSRKRSD